MAVERLPKSIADPCCGSGAILDVLAEAGHIVFGADVVDYGWHPGCTVIRDYLAEPVEINRVGIVTNPPYRLAEAFIRKAISDGCHYHAWLLRTNFLESVSRLALWRDHPPSRIWIGSRRLPMMHRQNYAGPKSSSNVSYMWLVFDARDANRCKLGWVDWKGMSDKIAREVASRYPPKSEDCASAKTFVFLHRLSIAAAFHNKLRRSDVVAALARLFEDQKDNNPAHTPRSISMNISMRFPLKNDLSVVC
jgi:hypothetical protein